MPKNKRIIEKVIGQNKSGEDLWDSVEDFTELEPGDHVRIFEDKKSKSDNVELINGFVQRKPWSDIQGNVAELAIESLSAYTKRKEEEQLKQLRQKAAENLKEER